eukprot:6993309-Pyramimonas_sp.AAC.2
MVHNVAVFSNRLVAVGEDRYMMQQTRRSAGEDDVQMVCVTCSSKRQSNTTVQHESPTLLCFVVSGGTLEVLRSSKQ